MSTRFWGLEGFAIVFSTIAFGGAVRVLYSTTIPAKYLLLRRFDLLSSRFGNFERMDGISKSE